MRQPGKSKSAKLKKISARHLEESQNELVLYS